MDGNNKWPRVRIAMMKWAVAAAIALLSSGCATLPPFLQRWADLDVSTSSLTREDSKTGEGFRFYQDGFADVYPSRNDAPRVQWRVRGLWLEIDTTNDGTFHTRMRAVSFTKDRIIVVSATGKRSVWRNDRVVVVIKMIPQRPGFWMP